VGGWFVIDIPGYLIKREIGAGGMASVYLAVQTSLDREVALKVMAPALAADPTFSKRFLQEARMLASLAHPNIVAVYDVGVSLAQLHYFSMQYLPGGDFAARIARGIDERELTQTIVGVAHALGYAHQRGYVHRDVAPGNILYDANNNPVLTDFGIALAVAAGSRITSTGFSVGTSHYMSPEQARGGDVDLRSDIYSLGVLCYYGLTGKPPYDGADGFAVAYAHVFEPIPRLPVNRGHWQHLIDCALAKDAKDRYADTKEFLDALATVVPQYAALFRDELVVTPPALLTPPPPATMASMPAPRAAGNGADMATRAVKHAPAADTATNPRLQRPPAVAAPPLPGTDHNWTRLWPLLIVLLGMGLIGFALLARSGKHPPVATLPSVATEPANPKSPATDSSSTTAPAATAPAGATETASVPAATAMDSIEAAEAQVAGDNGPDSANLPTVADPAADAIRLGRIDLAAQRLTTPPGANALDHFMVALKLDSKNKAAKQGIVDIAKKYIEFAAKNLAEGDAVQFGEFLDRAIEVSKVLPDNSEVMKDIAAQRAKAAEPFIAQAKLAATAWDKAGAMAAYKKALKLDPNNTAARDGVKFAASIGEAGFAFRDKLTDGAQGPEMVSLDARLAMARYDVTRGEFRRFWNETGRATFAGKEPSCRDRESIFHPSKQRGWENPDIAQNDSHPVVCVGWQEATGFAQWLSKQTGKHYRLPSLAEFDRRAVGDAYFRHRAAFRRGDGVHGLHRFDDEQGVAFLHALSDADEDRLAGLRREIDGADHGRGHGAGCRS